jgi:hypothetical protein
MKKKFVAIVVLMLVATTVVSATKINVNETNQTTTSEAVSYGNNHIINYQPTLFNWGVDQKQTYTDGSGLTLYPPEINAQSFTPVKDKLTAVSLWLFKYASPPEPNLITVVIRDNLTGPDLATKTIDTSVVSISTKGTWVVFDFDDISVTPETKYYIICTGTTGNPTNAYCWLFSANDTYTRGEAWYKANVNFPWNINHAIGDFCFKTYFRKPLDGSVPTLSNEISNQKAIAISAQPFSVQFHQEQTLIVQPTGTVSSQSRKPGIIGTDAQVTTFTEADSHPWVEVDNKGNPMVVYDHDTGLGYHEIYLQRSSDGGKTWPADQRYYLVGNESTSAINPVIELVDNGTRAIVFFQIEPLDPRYYTIDLRNIDNPATWVVTYGENASVNPWVGQQTLDMIGDHIVVMASIGRIIWGGYDCNSTFLMNWAYDVDNISTYGGMFFYYPIPDTGYSYCCPTAAAGTKYLYGAAQYNLPTGKSQICVTWSSMENLSWNLWKYFFFGVGGHNLTNPDLAASGQYAYLAIQTDEKGNNDILCYTPPTTGTNWKKHVVANSSDDEMYPSITAVGKTVVITFVKNGNLYSSKSEDGGLTWSTPEQINDATTSIIGGYRCANIEGPCIAWMDNRNGNADIYADLVTMPWLAFKKCTGGLGCSVEDANVGTGDATAVEWNMHVGGGMKGLINKTTNGTIDIAAGKSGIVKSGVFFGLGKIFMTATVGGGIIEKEGKHLLIFSMVK